MDKHYYFKAGFKEIYLTKFSVTSLLIQLVGQFLVWKAEVSQFLDAFPWQTNISCISRLTIHVLYAKNFHSLNLTTIYHTTSVKHTM